MKEPEQITSQQVLKMLLRTIEQTIGNNKPTEQQQANINWLKKEIEKTSKN